MGRSGPTHQKHGNDFTQCINPPLYINVMPETLSRSNPVPGLLHGLQCLEETLGKRLDWFHNESCQVTPTSRKILAIIQAIPPLGHTHSNAGADRSILRLNGQRRAAGPVVAIARPFSTRFDRELFLQWFDEAVSYQA